MVGKEQVKREVISSVSYLQRKNQSTAAKMQHWVPVRAEKIKTPITAARRATQAIHPQLLELKAIVPILQRRKLRLRKVFMATQNVMGQPDSEPGQPGSPVGLIHCMYNLLFSIWCSVPPFVIITPPY